MTPVAQERLAARRRRFSRIRRRIAGAAVAVLLVGRPHQLPAARALLAA